MVGAPRLSWANPANPISKWAKCLPAVDRISLRSCGLGFRGISSVAALVRYSTTRTFVPPRGVDLTCRRHLVEMREKKMNDTITLTGIVATTPKHIVTSEQVTVTSFRLAATQRRFDSDENKWIDGNTNWYTVTAFATSRST